MNSPDTSISKLTARRLNVILVISILGLIMALSVTIILVGSWYVMPKPFAYFSSNLSIRAKEFIENQAQGEGSPWIRTTVLAPTSYPLPDIDQETVHTTDCLTITLPFQSNYPKKSMKEDTCVLQFSLTKPRAKVTVSYDPTPEKLLAITPSVTMRQESAEYSPLSLTFPNYSTVYAFEKTDEITIFLADAQGKQVIVSFYEFHPADRSYFSDLILQRAVESIAFPDPTDDETFYPPNSTE